MKYRARNIQKRYLKRKRNPRNMEFYYLPNIPPYQVPGQDMYVPKPNYPFTVTWNANG